jgi:tetratricopeptide (TPR) repeat protein
MMEIAALTNMAGLQYVHGELGSALSTCQEVVDLAKSRLGPNSPFIGKTLVNLGEILREQGDYEAAETYFVDGARLMENYIEIGLPLAYLSIARLKMDQMDWPASQSYIDQARQLAKATKSTPVDSRSRSS